MGLFKKLFCKHVFREMKHYRKIDPNHKHSERIWEHITRTCQKCGKVEKSYK